MIQNELIDLKLSLENQHFSCSLFQKVVGEEKDFLCFCFFLKFSQEVFQNI
jgi:hypothetical protein